MIGCASTSPPLTPVAVSHGKKNSPLSSPFLGGGSAAVPFPPARALPSLRLPPRRVPAAARAAYAAVERERESEYTASAGGSYSSYSYTASAGGGGGGGGDGSYYSSSSYSHSTSNPMSAFAAAAAPPSLYDVLGLPSRATAPEIKAAYRRLARSCHPDAASKGSGGNGASGSASAEQFMRVHAAYATLSDPDKRAEYDRGLAISVSSPGRWAGSSRVYQRTTSYPAAGGGGSTASSAYSGSPGFQSGFGRRTWETDQCW